MIFKILYTVVPRDAGKWGCVVPLTHVAAHAEIRSPLTERPTARGLNHPKELMCDGPEDCARLRAACTLLETCLLYTSPSPRDS